MNRGMLALAFALFTLVAASARAVEPDREEIDLAGRRDQSIRTSAPAVRLTFRSLLPAREYTIDALNALLEEVRLGDGSAEATLCEAPAAFLAHRLRGAKDERELKAILDAAHAESANCAEEKRRPALDAVAQAREATSKTLPLALSLTKSTELTIRRAGADPWTVFIGAPDAADSTIDPDLLDEIEDRMAADSSPTVLECSYPDQKCETEPLFVNADHVSAVVFRGIPTGKELLVIADPLSQPFEGCQAIRQNRARWNAASAPDTVVVTLQMFRKPLGFLSGPVRRLDAALRLYGFNNQETPLTKDQIQRLCRADPAQLLATKAERSFLMQARGSIREVAGVPIIVDGLTEQVKVTLYSGSDAPKSFVIPFNYQRWWVDAGGAFLFPRRTREALSTVPQTNGTVKVTALTREETTDPETGIVINLHPGNYPELALQFGLATGEGAGVSYYLGPALRLREIGKRGLATFSAGVVLGEAQRYPGLEVAPQGAPNDKGFYDPSDPRLQGRSAYELGWYLGISLGFSFGGVTVGADSVKELK